MLKCYTDLNQILTLKKAHKKDGRNLVPEDLSLINNGAIIFNQSEILWVGAQENIPPEYQSINQVSLKGHVLTPEIVDSHTHTVFAGDRAREYSMRLNGDDYQKIADAGGGILATVHETIKQSEEELFSNALERVEQIAKLGVGTIEIKSGYGLTFDSEYKISKVIKKLKQHFQGNIQIINTYLAAHAVPKAFTSSHEYMKKIVLPLLQKLHQEDCLDFVDIFHEQGYFDLEDCKLLFNLAKELGIKIKIHADEFNDNKGAILATEFGASSADHLLCTDEDGINALASSNTVATLLPGTAFFLGKPLANAKQFLDAGCKVAIASDYNPGSCHCSNLLLIAALSGKSLGLNLTQLWASITLNASHALNLKEQGAIIPGLKPRFSLFESKDIHNVIYSWGQNLARQKKLV